MEKIEKVCGIKVGDTIEGKKVINIDHEWDEEIPSCDQCCYGGRSIVTFQNVEVA